MLNRSTIESYVQRILYPLIKLLIHHGITESHFSRIARTVYVKVGAEKIEREAEEQQKLVDDSSSSVTSLTPISTRPTAARISVITGVPRKAIPSILDDALPNTPDDEWYRHRCGQILSDWWKHPEYLNNRGAPIAIPLNADDSSLPSFENLVAMSGTDLSYHAVLEELKAAGAVQEIQKGKRKGLLDVKTKIFRRRGISDETFASVADTYYNVGQSILNAMIKDDPNITEGTVATLRADPKRAHILLKRLRDGTDAFLRSQKAQIESYEVSESDADATTVRVGLGVYVFTGDEMAESQYFLKALEEALKVSNE